MKLIHSKAELLQQPEGLEGVYKMIEIAGRTCYKSEDKITEDSAKGFVERMIKSGHCYTENSQILTENGWIYWKAYNGEKVAVVNQRGDFVGFETPMRVISHKYTGNFYYYPSLGIEVTEGHRMYGIFRESKNDFYNNTSYDLFMCGQPYKDNNGREKTLGERMFKTPKHCTKPIQSNPYYELIGFWLGDGCYTPQTVNKLVFHLKKKRKIEYLKTLCDELGYSFEVGKGNYYRVHSPQIGAKFNALFYKDGNKYIPNMYKADDSVAVKSVILGLINSDGSIGVNTKTVTFTNTSLDIILWLENVAVIGGFTVSYKGRSYLSPKHKPVYKILLLDTNYTINNDSRNPDSKVIITNKTEDVYCVTVSTGLILVKGNNGVTSICGNCAMLEHGTVYLFIPWNEYYDKEANFRYFYNKYSVHKRVQDVGVYITTNYRVLVENGWLKDLKFVCEPTEHHERRYTMRFTTDQGVMRELTRHRKFSFAVESTRYCNYSKDKFGNELTFITPSWCYIPEGSIISFSEDNEIYNKVDLKKLSDTEYTLVLALNNSEQLYLDLVKQGWQPQQARQVLPLATKCDIVMTGFASDWRFFLDLRYFEKTGKVHPDMLELTNKLKNELVNAGIWDDIMNHTSMKS